MKCPHCLNGIHSNKESKFFGSDIEGHWTIIYEQCPECQKYIIELECEPFEAGYPTRRIQVYPKGVSRAPVPEQVPNKFADDYKEACLVFSDSPKASSALSRRCLQNILREKAGIKKNNLADEIQQVLKSNQLPSHLSTAIDAVRNIGNFAAHPIKSTNTGQIVDVEPGEAEWLLDVLEGLFDFYFIQPAILKKKRAELDKKLGDAGKPPMKSP
ncbi:MAG: DUF4145 domain-containing protein [Phycisphaerales bacterium]|jgi:hypothetical protein